ncbi:MAG: DUF4198 domain-containing protein [Acidobacteria bacterium]|nr:DUF4198 domain-containing protein [Acidobacteriota bacterium]
MKTIPVLAILLCAAAQGHDMYILPGTFFPAQGATVTAGFHVGDSFPESEVRGRLDRLVNPRLLWKTGSAAFQNLRVDGKRDAGDAVAGGSGELIATVSTLPNLIELAPAKFTAYLKEEGLTDVIAWRARHAESARPGKERYSKYAKAILLSGATNGFAGHAVGSVLEILPEADPYTLNPGALLPVRVLFRGKPAGGLQLESSWASKAGRKTTVAGRTGSDGRLKVLPPAAGLWRLHTIRMERCAEPAAADWESFWASLTFELRQR